MKRLEPAVNIIGAGLAGLSAAYVLAESGVRARLISLQTSERAASNLAAGGINGVLDVSGEHDSIAEHIEDTLTGGRFLADPEMVRGMANAAPAIILRLSELGVPFNRKEDKLVQRPFGGQSKKRTAFAKSSTGKYLVRALTDAVRKYESDGIIERFSRHRFTQIIQSDGQCTGACVTDTYDGGGFFMPGAVIMCCGGLNGFFPGLTTGSMTNSGSAAASLYASGIEFSNLEFIQYHPTTTPIAGKRLLVSEAARGEGARLFVEDEKGNRIYFMEDKYGTRGNLMPRDVISYEMVSTGRQAYLDYGAVTPDIWESRLSDMREEIIHYTGMDPVSACIPVAPGIHFFMGGIPGDARHRTNISGLWACGECAAAYHGANRLGGNSLLGAIYGGSVAAADVAKEFEGHMIRNGYGSAEDLRAYSFIREDETDAEMKLESCLARSMGIIKSENDLRCSMEMIDGLLTGVCSDEMRDRLLLGRAMLTASSVRRESRGAHRRADFPLESEKYMGSSVSRFENGKHAVSFVRQD